MKPLFLLFLIIPQLMFAQESGLWVDVPIESTARVSDHWAGVKVSRKQLNLKALDGLLAEVNTKGTTKITIPHPSGEAMSFDIQPSSVMAPALQSKYPEIQTFKGRGKGGSTIRMDVSPLGLHGMIFTLEKGTIYINPESHDDRNNQYVSYYKSAYQQINGDNANLHEELDESHQHYSSNDVLSNDKFRKVTVGTQLKKYRMGVTAHPKFTQKVGGVNNALSGIVTMVNYANGLFERDLAITFELLANNDELVFTESNPGPFDFDESYPAFRLKNQELMDSFIGFDNYDVGHILGGNGGGGLAPVGSVCRDAKATAASDYFIRNSGVAGLDFNLFVHELGHQFGAFHTMNVRCSGVSPSYDSNYEPGSGSTLLSYGGLFCGPNDIAVRSDYFHTISIQEIDRYTAEEQGTCAELIATGNTPPAISVPEGGFVIPIRTPFVLAAEGEDADGDELTYCWEQFDKGPSSVVSNGGIDLEGVDLIQNQPFTGDGPLFRSFRPTTHRMRYFPQLSNVLDGVESNKEVLPEKTRDLNFVVTVRDNVGGMTNEIVSFSSTDQAGPFVVTSTFSEPSYNGLSNQTLEWEVANTDAAPVNCQQVTVLYSTNGGESFDITLLESTPNDGQETIKLPNIATTRARIMVKAADNIFFHVNDRNFSISASDVDVPEAATTLAGIRVDDTTIDLSWTDNSELEDGFIIERQTGPDAPFEELTRVVLNRTSYSDETASADESYAYRVAAFNATGRSPFTNVVSLGQAESPLGVDDTPKLILHPNPATNEVFLPSFLHNQTLQIEILSMNGSEMKHYRLNPGEQKIDVSRLSSGLFVVKIHTNDQVFTGKLFKK